MCCGKACRASPPLRLRRRPPTTPAWSSTASPSAVSQTSLSSPVAPSFRAMVSPSRLFSGAWARAPRWAKAIGGRRSESIAPYLLAPHRQGEGEPAARPQPALAPDAAAHQLDQTAAQVEPQPGLVDAEAFEQPGDVAGVDPGPRVGHGHLDETLGLDRLQQHRAVRAGHGVVEHVTEDVLEAVPVERHDQRVVGPLHRDAAALALVEQGTDVLFAQL